MLVKTLLRQIEADASSAGRDQQKLRLALRRRLFKLEMSAGPEDPEEWEPEYRTWLIDSFHQALNLAQDRAVAREEYEQAAEFLALAKDIQWLEEPSILT